MFARGEWIELLTTSALCDEGVASRRRRSVGTVVKTSNAEQHVPRCWFGWWRFRQEDTLEGADLAPANQATLTALTDPPSAHRARERPSQRDWRSQSGLGAGVALSASIELPHSHRLSAVPRSASSSLAVASFFSFLPMWPSYRRAWPSSAACVSAWQAGICSGECGCPDLPRSRRPCHNQMLWFATSIWQFPKR